MQFNSWGLLHTENVPQFPISNPLATLWRWRRNLGMEDVVNVLAMN
jgi:hypothetical protein